ncbi:hypothetical protein [Cupriavidus basilensis]
MDIEALRSTLEQASLASLGVGFLLGFVFTFNPVALAAIPVSLAYVTKTRDQNRNPVWRHVHPRDGPHPNAVRTAAGLGGQSVERIIGREWGVALAPCH